MRARVILMSIVVTAVVLAGCAGTSSNTAHTDASAASTPISTDTEAAFNAACQHAATTPAFTPVYRIGDMLIRAGYVGNGSRKLAGDTPHQPLQLPDPNDTAAMAERFPVEPVVNPINGGGFAFTLCNASPTQSHEVEGVKLRINQFTAYSGPVQTWNTCDGYYTRSVPQGIVGTGCSVAIQWDERMRVGLAAKAAAGTEETVTWVSAGTQPTDASRNTPFGPLPATVPPGQSMVVFMQSNLPVAAGTYEFAVAPIVDHRPLPFAPIGEPAIFSPGGLKWTGAACRTASMQRQIPQATTPPSFYICPVT